ncbi:MAG: CPBP family intramembrane metalloprotease [Streptosporangiales bacterium]|nr:CPBP family intramembrane metalloprotease [Streptosporangiales bacterium]
MTHDSSTDSASDAGAPTASVPPNRGPAQPPGMPPQHGEYPTPYGAAWTGMPAGGPPQPPAVPAPRRHWGMPSALIGLVLFIGMQLVVGVSFALAWVLTGNESDPPALAMGLATLLPAYLALLLWQFFVARRRGDGMRADYALRFRWYDIFTGILGGFVAMGVVLGGTLGMSELTGVEPSSSVGTTVLESTETGPVLYVFLVVIALVGPLVEELHFRGMWWRALRSRMGPVLTLVLTSLLFGVIHLEPVRMVGLLLGGLVLGLLRLLFDRLAPSLIAHILINSVSAGSLFYELVLK